MKKISNFIIIGLLLSASARAITPEEIFKHAPVPSSSDMQFMKRLLAVKYHQCEEFSLLPESYGPVAKKFGILSFERKSDGSISMNVDSQGDKEVFTFTSRIRPHSFSDRGLTNTIVWSTERADFCDYSNSIRISEDGVLSLEWNVLMNCPLAKNFSGQRSHTSGIDGWALSYTTCFPKY